MTRLPGLLASCGVASLVLHGAAVWPFLPHGSRRAGLEAPAVIEVELVEQRAEAAGSPDASPGQRSAAEGEARPVPPAPSTRPGPASPPAVNLRGDTADQEGLVVSGPMVVPPRPDATVHNRPPAYPADAARRGAEGVVGLVVHVSALGIPAWVDVARSSGDASLDRSARDAVTLWRFQPARQAGAAVAFDYELNIRFTLDGR